jgi:site-specific recombinase XerD
MNICKRENGVYYLWYKDGVKKSKVSCKTKRKDQAMKFLKDFQVSRLGQKDVEITLNKFIQVFLEHVQQTLSNRSVKEYKNTLRRFQAFLGNKLLNFISIKDCHDYQSHLIKHGVKPSSSNEYIAKLQCCLQRAVRWGYISNNPFSKVERLKVQKTPPVFMNPDQVKLFLHALPTSWKNLFLFALLTGCRASELVNLRWVDLDFVRRTIQIGNKYFTTKTRKVRLIPMHDSLFSMLQVMKQDASSELVFPNPNGQKYSPIYVGYIFKRTVRKLGLPEELHLHSTRHTFASLLVQSGVPIYSVSKLLGHSSVQMTQVYAHLQPETLHSSIERLQLIE